MQERRTAQRFRSNFNARWESLLDHGRGSVSDLSSTGCFILCGAELKSGELIRLEIDFPNHLIFAWGQVVYCLEEIGFALRFVFGEESEERALRKLIEQLPQSV